MKWPWISRTRFEREMLHNEEVSGLREQANLAELSRLRAYILKLEGLIDLERERYEAERRRADRLQDTLSTQAGLPPATETVLGERALADAAAAEEGKKMARQMKELFSEQTGVLHDELGFELPPQLKEGVEAMMKRME